MLEQPAPLAPLSHRGHAGQSLESRAGGGAGSPELDADGRVAHQPFAQGCGRSVGHDTSAVDDEHALTDLLHLGQYVRGEEHSVLAAELVDELADLDDLVGIEPHRRLVENQHLWAVDQRPRKPDALAVALGQSAHHLAAHVADQTAFDGIVHARAYLRPRHLLDVGSKVKILVDPHLGVQRHILR